MIAPGYWPYESSGILRPAIEAYLKNAEMSTKQIALMRAYLRQWINNECWDRNPHATAKDKEILFNLRLAIDALTSRQDIETWLTVACDQGIDPI